MSYIRSEILAAAQKLGVELIELPADDAEAIRMSIESKYTTGQPYNFLWEYLVSDTAVENADAWQWINGFVEDSETILMFDQANEESIYLFKDGSQVVPVLDECFYAYRDCYLTDKDLSYVLCFNHHNWLIACGRATAWLQSEIASRTSDEK